MIVKENDICMEWLILVVWVRVEVWWMLKLTLWGVVIVKSSNWLDLLCCIEELRVEMVVLLLLLRYMLLVSIFCVVLDLFFILILFIFFQFWNIDWWISMCVLFPWWIVFVSVLTPVLQSIPLLSLLRELSLDHILGVVCYKVNEVDRDERNGDNGML